MFDETDLRDPLDLLQTGKDQARPERARKRHACRQEMREPVQALGLEWPVSMDVLKARYKELAKRHHPDANGGDRACRGASEDDQPRICRRSALFDH